MIYKSYKFKHNESGEEIKVRFYFTGIYTIVDKNGEHEMGEWYKEPLLVGKWLRPSKDKSCVIYRARPFDSTYVDSDYSLRTLALILANNAVTKNLIAV